MPSIEKMEKTAVDLSRQAEVYLAEGRLNEAVAACESALKIEPNLAMACQTLGKVMQVRGEIEQAKQWYEAALDRNPNLPEVYANLGSLYAHGKQWEKAIANCEKAISLAPNFGAAYRQLARVWTQLDKREEAAECWYQAFNIEPNWATADEHVTLGNSFVEVAKFDRASECYSRAIELNPKLATAYHNLGEMLIGQKRWDEAIANYRQAIAINPDSFESYHSLGKTWAERGEGDRAIACYRKSLELNPNYARAYLSLGNVWMQKGELDEAIKCYFQTLAINNNSAWAHNYLGQALARQRKWEEAVACYRRAIELEPKIPWFYCNLGSVLTCEKSWDASVAAFLQAIKLEPNLTGINTRLGYALQQRSASSFESTIQSYCQAIDVLENGKVYHKLLQIETEGAEFYLNLAQSLAKQKQLEGAIVFYQMALQIEPNVAETIAELDWLLAKKQYKTLDFDELIAACHRQIEIDPNNSEAYNDLGNILPQLGELEEAIVCHQKASELRGWPECTTKNYQFSQDWFTHNIPIWQKHLQQFAGMPEFQVVEIGSFQGMSACWLLDNILTHPTAKITCIDPYFQEQFKGNIAKTGVADKVIALEGYSQDLLGTLASEFYDISYVDGCHKPTSALQDAILSWRLVKVGGLMIFDDYEFTFPDSPEDDTKIGIDRFLEMFGSQLEVVHKGYQLIVRKTDNKNLGVEQNLLASGCEKLGDMAANAGYLDAAIERYQAAIKVRAGNFLSYHKLGNALQKKELFDEAITAYERSIELNSNFSWSYHFLGETLQAIEKYEEAAAAYRKAIEFNPNFCWNYNQLGEALMQLSKPEEATAAYRKLVELNPDFCWSYERLGKALRQLKNWEESAQNYRKAIELYADDCWLYNSLGEVLELQENWAEAAVAFGHAVELAPDNCWLYKKLGDALRKQGEVERAIVIYEKGINLDPKSCWCYEGLGLSFLAKQQWEPAITNLIQTLQIKPDLFGIYYHIADALAQQGAVDEADIIRLGYKMLPLSVIKKYCGFTDDLAIAAESDSSITCIDIYPASQINLSNSQTIDTDCRCWEDEFFHVKKSFVAVLPNGRAWADIATTAAITSDNKLITDISMGCPELVITSDKLPPTKHIEGNVAFLSARWGGAAYFHWMFDVVTRFHLLQQSGLMDSIDKFAINACDSAYEKETLNTLGIPLDKILESRHQPHFTADKLIVPSICDGGSGTSKWKCEYLKKLFLNEQQSLNTNYSERIYISRKKASYRRIINEQDVIGCLEKLGFRSVEMETMSVAEQAACLAAAKVVVAPHGGGLTNLVFCNPGTKVIEIFSPIYVPSCFWTISNLCDLKHYYLIAELFDDKTHQYSGHKDLRVDLNSLEKLMNLAGVLHG